MRPPLVLPPATAGLVQWLNLRLALLRQSVIMGVRVVVLDGAGRVFLVRHSYVPGWHFPGGGVEKRETCRMAAIREVREEAGLSLQGDIELLGLYLNRAMADRNHVAVFVARAFDAIAEPEPDWEIVERGFFPLDALPEGTTAGTRARLAEIAGDAARSEMW